jgi:VWFA-related protein
MQNTPGRKALLMFTDGVDAGSKTSLAEAVEQAQRSDTLVYSILYADHGKNPPRDRRLAADRKGIHILTELASHTGGGFFTVTAEHPLEEALDRIQAELRTQYSIGFIPAANVPGEYRQLGLKVNREGLVVRSRDGYYSR